MKLVIGEEPTRSTVPDKPEAPQPIVLILDDESAVCHIMKTEVVRLLPNCECLLARGSNEAIALLTERAVDILVSDISLGMSDPLGGFSAIKTGRQLKGDTLTIIAMSSGNHEAQALHQGANKFFNKRSHDDFELAVASLVMQFWRKRTTAK
jgi:CheY-like chemotaxis protein